MSRFPFCDTNKKVGTRPLHVSKDITAANQSARRIHPPHQPQSPGDELLRQPAARLRW